MYKHGLGVDHAPYMVSVKKTKDEVTATEIVRDEGELDPLSGQWRPRFSFEDAGLIIKMLQSRETDRLRRGSTPSFEVLAKTDWTQLAKRFRVTQEE